MKRDGAGRAAGHFDKKQDAVDRARDIAKNDEPSQVIIHGQDGKIQSERTYKRDPYPPKG